MLCPSAIQRSSSKQAALATEPQDMIGFRIGNWLWSFRSHTRWACGHWRRMRHGIKALGAIELCVLLVADSLRPMFPRMPGHREAILLQRAAGGWFWPSRRQASGEHHPQVHLRLRFGSADALPASVLAVSRDTPSI